MSVDARRNVPRGRDTYAASHVDAPLTLTRVRAAAGSSRHTQVPVLDGVVLVRA